MFYYYSAPLSGQKSSGDRKIKIDLEWPNSYLEIHAVKAGEGDAFWSICNERQEILFHHWVQLYRRYNFLCAFYQTWIGIID